MRTFLFVLIFSSTAFANGPKTVHISGRILDNASSQPLSAASVDFKLQVLSPNNCLLYEEQHLGKDLSASQGTFSLSMGMGSAAMNVYASAGQEQSSENILRVFSNSSVVKTGLSSEDQGSESTVCNGTYTPAAGDVRKVKVIFNTGVGGDRAILPYYRIGTVPYAMVSQESAKSEDSDKLGGVVAAAYLKLADLASQVASHETDPSVQGFAKSALPSCAGGEVLKSNGSAFSCVTDLTGSSGDASYAAKGVLRFDTSAAVSGISIVSGVASVNSGVGAHQIVKLDGSSRLPAVDGSALLNLNATNLSTGTLPTSVLPVIPLANGGTGASTAAGARTALGLGTAAQLNTGSASGNVPVLGVAGMAANKMCVSDGAGSGIICNTNIPGTNSLVGSLLMVGKANCIWGRTSGSFGIFSNDSDCNTAVVKGMASTPTEGKIPAIRFANLPAGDYEVTMNLHAMRAENYGETCSFRLWDGSSFSGTSTFLNTYLNSVTGIFSYATDQTNLTIYLQARSPYGVESCLADIGDVEDTLEIWVKKL